MNTHLVGLHVASGRQSLIVDYGRKWLADYSTLTSPAADLAYWADVVVGNQLLNSILQDYII